VPDGTTLNNTSYPPPNVQPQPTYAPSFGGGYHPAAIQDALIKAGAPPSVAPTLTAITGAESNYGKSPISGVNKDGSRDYGIGQINNKAWPELGGASVATQPLDQQAAAIVHVYNKQGLNAWTTYKNGAYKKHLGEVGAPGAPTTTTTPPITPAQSFSVGAALGALTTPNAAGASPLGDAQKMLDANQGPQQQQAQQYAQQGMLQQQQAAAPAGMARQQQIAAQAAQLAALTRQGAAQPLTWGSRPFGSQAGQQMAPPGTTLNTTGAG
jgi:hypothetical protein